MKRKQAEWEKEKKLIQSEHESEVQRLDASHQKELSGWRQRVIAEKDSTLSLIEQ